LVGSQPASVGSPAPPHANP